MLNEDVLGLEKEPGSRVKRLAQWWRSVCCRESNCRCGGRVKDGGPSSQGTYELRTVAQGLAHSTSNLARFKQFLECILWSGWRLVFTGAGGFGGECGEGIMAKQTDITRKRAILRLP